MRIAMLIFRYFPGGGLQKDFLRIAKSAFSRGHLVDAYAYSWEGDPFPDFLTRHTLSVHSLSNHGKAAEFYSAVLRENLHERYDLVVGFNCGPDLDVCLSGDTCFKLRTEKYSKLYRLLGRSRTYVALENAVYAPESKTVILDYLDSQRRQFLDAYGTPENRFRRLRAGLNPENFAKSDGIRIRKRAELGLSNADLMLVTVSHDLIKKGADRAVLAIASLPEHLRRKVRYYILGNGKSEPESLMELIQTTELQDNIVFAGFRPDLSEYLAASDLLVHPARRDPAGSIVPEALTAALPVLCTANCGFASCVQEARAGCVVSEFFDQAELNSTLHSMLWNMARLRNLRRNAVRFVESGRFCGRAESAVDVMEEMYNARRG